MPSPHRAVLRPARSATAATGRFSHQLIPAKAGSQLRGPRCERRTQLELSVGNAVNSSAILQKRCSLIAAARGATQPSGHSLRSSLAAHATRSAGRQARKSNSTRHHGAPPPAEALWPRQEAPRPRRHDATHQTNAARHPRQPQRALRGRVHLYVYRQCPSGGESLHVAPNLLSSEDAKRYMRQSRLDVPPHVFAVAEAAFRGHDGGGGQPVRHHQRARAAPARRRPRNTSRCTRGVPRSMCCGGTGQEVFLESNPLLEAFGNTGL